MKTVSKKLLSLMLVAILLISAVPFQAFALTHDAAHESWFSSETEHWKTCKMTECDDYDQEVAGTRAPHNWSAGVCTDCGRTCTHSFAAGVCSICGMTCTHANEAWATDASQHWKQCPDCGSITVAKSNHILEMSCTDETGHFQKCFTCGYTGSKTAHSFIITVDVNETCTAPGHQIRTCSGCSFNASEVRPAAGHKDADGDKHCDVCGAWTGDSTIPSTGTLTLDANGGFCAVTVMNVANGYTLNTYGPLPVPTWEGHTFLGWYLNDTTYIENGTLCSWTGNATAKAHWAENSKNLTVKVGLDDGSEPIQTIFDQNVTSGTKLLQFLQNNETIKAKIAAALAAHPGYEWYEGYFYDYSGTQPLNQQDQKLDQAQTVFIRLAPKKFNITFVVGEGASPLSPNTKEVWYNQPVGELPTPTMKNKVFAGWVDETVTPNKVYTSATIYQKTTDTVLTAKWSDKAVVILNIFVNGNTSVPDSQLILDNYSTVNSLTGKYDNVTRAAVQSIITKKYAPMSGYTLAIDGLFTDDTWPDYVRNNAKPGTDTVQVNDVDKSGHPINVYVMVRNASHTTVNPTNPTKPHYPDNPKTGDQVMIEAAVSVMVIAAAGFVTLYILRKRKSM